MIVNSNGIPIVQPAFSTYVKENKYYNSAWLDALRVQLVQRGSTDRYLGYDVPKIGPGGTPGEDWIFRVDNFNPSRPGITWYEYDLNGGYQNFVALDGKRTFFNWKHYGSPTGIVTHNAPFLVTGIQNMVNFIFGYSDLRADEGWNFNDQDNPVLDPSTGRPIGYQLLVEQFIAQQFSGAVAGSAFLFNPFSRKVWYKTPRGIVTDLFDMLGLEQETVPTLLNSNHHHIEHSKIRVFRQDEITQIVFDEPAFTLHLLTSEYEHVVLFEDYSASVLLFDSFLGQKTGDVFLNGERQTVFSGRMDFGGHFLLGDQMKRNIESSVEGILGLYNTTSTLPTPAEKEQARSLLGFQKKSYFADRGTPDQTEFRFWQGLIANKGTNFSIAAYVNSQRFKNAKLDEYWAYKLTEYGDARPITKAEMKAESEDCFTEMTNYLFLEDDELGLIDSYMTNGGYDIPSYGSTPYDSFSLYTVEQAAGMEFFDPRGCVIIQPADEARWFRYNDLKTLEYFTADIVAEFQLVPDSLEKCYTILNLKGQPVRADCFELVNVNYAQNTNTQERYYEMGDYIPGTNPPEYSDPKFKRVNSSTIQILDPALISLPFKVIAYGPAISKYSPNILVDYQSNTTAASDIIWWDPARGSHHPAAYNIVDYEQPNDPAHYNVGVFSYKNERLQKQKPWGEKEVGKIWWNNTNLDWQYYADTKIYTDYHERLARWGSPADYSNMEVYEWIKSSVSPQDYELLLDADGVLASKYTLNRDRTWYQRVVAWKQSDNPATLDRHFLAYQPSSLKISVDSTGYGKAILKKGSLEDVNITSGSKFTAVQYANFDKVDANILSVSGQANAISDPGVLVGSYNSYDGGAIFTPNPNITLNLTVDDQILSFREDVLDQYQLSNQLDPQTGKRYIKLTHIDSQKNQSLEVRDVPIEAGTLDEYKFDQLGIVITYSVEFDRYTLVLPTSPNATTLKRAKVSPSSGIVNESGYEYSLYTISDLNPATSVPIQAQQEGNVILWAGFTKGIGFTGFPALLAAATSYPNITHAYIYDEAFLGPGGTIQIGLDEPAILNAAQQTRNAGLKPVITILPDIILDPAFAMTSINTYDVIAVNVYPFGRLTPIHGDFPTLYPNILSDLLYSSVQKLRGMGFTGEIWYIYQAFGLHTVSVPDLTAGFNLQMETLDACQGMGVTGIAAFGFWLGPQEIQNEPFLFQGAGTVFEPQLRYPRAFTNTSTQRMQLVADLIGDPSHDIYLRSYVDIFNPAPFSSTILNGNNDGTTTGWVAWDDPVTNPNSGPLPPFNKYTPILGKWTLVGDYLSDLAPEISIRTTDVWTGFEGENFSPFKSVWSVWHNMIDEVYDRVYCTTSTFTITDFFDTYFTLTDTKLTEKEILDRADVYVNNIIQKKNRWTLDVSGDDPTIRIDQRYLRKGDRVRVQIRKYIPTSQDLSFNPDVSDTNPLIITQWAHDYPCVVEDRRNFLGGLTIKNYYFWVKNKATPALNKAMSVKQAATLLRSHDGTYSVPQAYKYYNQVDARPNRYAMLSMKNLGRYVKIRDTYKLRLTRDPTMRDDDMDLSLKNTHVEWKLLRQYQPLRIPQILWDLLTDTLAGETALGEVLPFEPLSSFDERNGTTERFGFIDQQQILTDPDIAKATLKHTVLNTEVDKYVGGQYVPDYISYAGFDINSLDVYLSSATNIRKFMSDLWRYAKPKQLNEIFFAVLSDAAACNLELTDFFKTSFIAMNDIRTIDTPGNLL